MLAQHCCNNAGKMLDFLLVCKEYDDEFVMPYIHFTVRCDWSLMIVLVCVGIDVVKSVLDLWFISRK